MSERPGPNGSHGFDEPSVLERQLNAMCALDAPAAAALAARLGDPGSEQLWRMVSDHRSSMAAAEGALTADRQTLGGYLGLLESHPHFGEREPAEVSLDLFSGARDREFEDLYQSLRADAADVIVEGLLALPGIDRPPNAYVDVLIRTAFGADDASTLLRQTLLSRKELPRLPKLPKWGLVGVDDLERLGCPYAILSAAHSFGQAVQESRVTVWTTGITSIDPNKGCKGDEIHIRGRGFGQQPPGAFVLMPRYGGGCVSTTVESWADDDVVVKAPQDVGWGCVGFAAGTGGSGELFEAATMLAGELERCLGPAAHQASQHLQQHGTKPVIVCPECLAGNANLFMGGSPWISSFTGNDATQVDLVPGGALRLKWAVLGADRIEIRPAQVGGTANELPTLAGTLNPAGGWYELYGGVPGTRDWDGAYELLAWNACTGPLSPVSSKVKVRMRRRVAIALSGGGAKGSFEVGALRFIYEKGIRPQILTAASVGSVNAVKLAEGDDPPGPTAMNAQQNLEAIWSSDLEDEDSMYGRMPWLNQLANNDIKEAIVDGAWGGAIGLGVAALGGPVVFAIGLAYGIVDGIFDANDLADALDKLQHARGVFQLGPIEALLRSSDKLDTAKVASSGIVLRMAAVALESGKTKFVNEKGELLSATGVKEATVGLVDGAIASASIPIVFPPRKLGNENFVDGGVREMIPVREAVRLGASEVYAIYASPRVTPSLQSFDAGDWPLAGIGQRAIADLMVDEIGLDDGAPYLGWGPGVKVTIIRPTFEVHDTLTIDPGLIDIAMDYGHLRASDVIDFGSSGSLAMTTSDAITKLRMECWDLEYSVNGVQRPRPRGALDPTDLHRPKPKYVSSVPDPFALDLVRAKKKAIFAAVQQRKGSGQAVPTGAQRWWLSWEKHRAGFTPYTPDPWTLFSSKLGSRPAVTPPS
jgi:predicted acylesterase/phospholipase RssA